MMPLLLVEDIGSGNILDSLVRELEILLEGDGVLDLEPDDGSGQDDGGTEKTPLLRMSVSICLCSDMH